ncbi:MAG TPA: glycerol-3-phosphate acyltransferase [Candidatus Cloacimonadota bacterium]|nr:glycerol-3-phosphate acyltransferase [Candidatus Cloacimonadota bacterium]HPT72886.1 glycerol-3-phosphate acyltransferase [Candidatus Cloacimonadota bacterium]
MFNIVIVIVVCLISYLFGCVSTSRFVARTYRNLKLDKIGTGLADTENIYTNVDKMLGILVGTIDVAKMYVYLLILRFVLDLIAKPLTHTIYMMIFAAVVLIGHCLPLTHRLRGGRGIFTYIGLVGYFAWMPALISGLFALIFISFFKQIRFAQYMVVILPAFINLGIRHFLPSQTNDVLTSITTFPLVVIAILMGVLNILVSKRLGEI